VRFVVGFCILIALQISLLAAPITYTLSGTLSGSVGATPFTNVAFTFTFTGDTGGVFAPGPAGVLLNPIPSNSILLGAQSGQFTEPVDTIVNANTGDAGFVDPALTKGLTIPNAGFVGWNLATGIGPLPNVGAPTAVGIFNTSFGTLTLTSAQGVTFGAVVSAVPEPVSTALLGIGLLAFVIAGRKLRVYRAFLTSK
jgi:hypothetical protein